MTIVDTMFTLRRISPFDRLHVNELFAVSEVVRRNQFAPRATILLPGQPANHLFILSAGGARLGDGPDLLPIFGLNSLLFDRAPAAPVLADADQGAEALMIAKRHVRTLMSECPALVVGLFESVGLTVAQEV